MLRITPRLILTALLSTLLGACGGESEPPKKQSGGIMQSTQIQSLQEAKEMSKDINASLKAQDERMRAMRDQ
ncbi:MAG: hypothetical protein ABW089_10490 [Sedimenticola sp.]